MTPKKACGYLDMGISMFLFLIHDICFMTNSNQFMGFGLIDELDHDIGVWSGSPHRILVEYFSFIAFPYFVLFLLRSVAFLSQLYVIFKFMGWPLIRGGIVLFYKFSISLKPTRHELFKAVTFSRCLYLCTYLFYLTLMPLFFIQISESRAILKVTYADFGRYGPASISYTSLLHIQLINFIFLWETHCHISNT